MFIVWNQHFRICSSLVQGKMVVEMLRPFCNMSAVVSWKEDIEETMVRVELKAAGHWKDV